MPITFWLLPNSGFQTGSNIRDLLIDFSKTHPDIEVDTRILTRTEMWQRLFKCQREMVDFDIPDIVEIPHYWTALFSQLGVLHDLNETDSALSTGAWIEPLRPHCLGVDGKHIFSVPWTMDVTALHYRTDHLAEITADPDSSLKHWEEFVKICGMLADKNSGSAYYPLENANVRGSLTVRDVLPCIWGRGGDIFSPDFSRSTIHREEVLRGMEDYLTLFQRGFMPLMREKGSLGTVSQGRASMALSRRQPEAMYLEPSDNIPVKTVPVPGDVNGSHGYLSSYNLGIAARSGNKSEAFTLLRWLASSANQIRYSKMIKAFPCSSAGFEQFIFSSHERMSTYAEIVAGARTLPNITVCGTYLRIIDEGLEDIATALSNGSYSYSTLMQEMVKAQMEVDYLLALYGN